MTTKKQLETELRVMQLIAGGFFLLWLLTLGVGLYTANYVLDLWQKAI